MINPLRGRSQQQTGKEQKTTQQLPESMWAADDTMPSGTPPEGTVVITISRQFGSGGSDIARLVAQKSKLQHVDRQVIDEVSQQLNTNVQQPTSVHEPAPGLAGYILGGIQASNPFVANYSSLLGQASVRTQSKDLAYFQLTQRVILQQATQGDAVIVDCGSQFLLHNAPHTLHIYIFAPLPQRIETIMARHNLNHNKAKHLIEQRDYERDSYLRRYYGSDGHQPELYHLLINTGLFSQELVVDFIQQSLPLAKAIHS